MYLGLCFGLVVAFSVLYLLSFLRAGAILRGGAVAVMHGEHKGTENASVTALQGKQRQMTLPKPLQLQLLVSTEDEGSELKRTQGDSNSFSLGKAMSPHSQSSQVFLKARRREQLRQRKLELIQQRGGDAAEVAAAEQEGVTTSTGSDVASAWDAKQLCADDRIRLVFLFTFALPVFAFWCWNLRNVRLSYLVYLYCYIFGVKREQMAPLVQFTLEAGPVFVSIGVNFLCFLYYAFFVYVDHRDKDVSLKRHNDTRRNRFINWFKFRIYRRYVNFQCFLWKRYFSLQLVPAYGPLPLFLFPERQEEAEGVFSNQTSNSQIDNTGASGGRGGGGGGGTPRHFATAAASARHNPFFVAVSSSAGEDSPLDNPLYARPSSVCAPAFNAVHASMSTSQTEETSADRLGRTQKPSCPSSVSVPCKSDVDNEGDCWDEEERGLLCRRGSDGSIRSGLPSSNEVPAKLGNAGSAEQLRERTDSFSSADLTKPLHPSTSSQAEETTATPPPPPSMRRAHYFFAAHPHGILPWCCCVNLISNVTNCNAKLFVDNRAAVLHPPLGERKGELLPVRGATEDAQQAAARGDGSFSAQSGNAEAFPVSTNASALKSNNICFTASPAVAGKAALPHSPTLSQQGKRTYPCLPPSAGSMDRSTTTTTQYAKGRYYVYHTSLKKFVLRLDKDEAVPATADDAAIYQQRLKAAEAKKAATQHGENRMPSVGQQLKIRIRAVVATFPFYVPIMREIYMFYGYMDASYETCKRVLLYNNSTRREREGLANASAYSPPPAEMDKSASSAKQNVACSLRGRCTSEEQGDSDDVDESTLPDDLNHLMLFPGGASEALLSSSHGPARVLLRRRKGFLRLALHTQSGLVPVYTFGETDYFDQFGTATTRYAAPLDDDSTFFSKGAPVHEDAAGTNTTNITANNNSDDTGGKPDGSTGFNVPRDHTSAAEYYRKVTPDFTDENMDEAVGVSGGRSLHSPLHQATTSKFGTKELHQSRRERLQRRPLRDEGDACDSEGYLPLLPAQLQSSTSRLKKSKGKLNPPLFPNTSSATNHAAAEEKSSRFGKDATTTGASFQPGRLPRLIQAVQRLFQETFGISLPVVRNLIPHRVVGATVVGRPIYFELPPDLQRMYTDPANYYDRDKERAVLLAAQEVYANELQELFLKYAPRYLKDPSRRRLEIL